MSAGLITNKHASVAELEYAPGEEPGSFAGSIPAGGIFCRSDGNGIRTCLRSKVLRVRPPSPVLNILPGCMEMVIQAWPRTMCP